MALIPTATQPDEFTTGCIEDRTVVGELNLFQLPGGDAFLTAAKDIIASADDSVKVGRFVDSVLRDAELTEHYTLHRDESHGDYYDGCGFLARQADIYRYLADNIDSIIERLNQASSDTITRSAIPRAKLLAATAGQLADNDDYFVLSGGKLVSRATQSGVETISYHGDHTAAQLTIDQREGETYDPITANDDTDHTETSFNVDIDSSLHRKAAQLDVTTDDAVLLAKLLSVATVDVLAGDIAPIQVIL